MITITREIATKVRDVVAAGLTNGVGKAEPGKMCVEAAVCFALGLPHGDDPGCVDPALRRLKIRLNDANWPSNAARAEGLRRLAVAQLGSLGAINTKDFVRRVVEMTIRTMVPIAMRVAARRNPKHAEALEAAAVRCEQEGTVDSARNAQRVARYADATAYTTAYTAAYAYAAADAATAAYAAAADAYPAAAAADAATAAYAAADAAYAAAAAADAYAARVKVLSAFAESVVQILIEMKAPGCEFLDLVPLEAAS